MKLLNLILLGAGGLVLYKFLSKKSAPEVPQQPIEANWSPGDPRMIFGNAKGGGIEDAWYKWQQVHPGGTREDFEKEYYSWMLNRGL